MIFDLQLNSRQPLAAKLLESAVRRGQLANAYLLAGRAVDDKWVLARQLACFLNCQRVFGDSRDEMSLTDLPSRRSCLIESPESPCQNCQWISRDQHPQAWLTLSGDKPGQKVPVEKARNLIAELSKTSCYYRTVVIPDAEEGIFHRPAANALLKSIEQPPGDNCLFLLFATNSEAVLPTIVSRSQTVLMNRQRTHAVAAAAEQTELQAILQVVRAKLVNTLRKTWSTGNTQPYLKGVTDSLTSVGELTDLLEKGATPDEIVDLLADSELEVLRGQALTQRTTADYLSAVLVLSESAKEQIRHYVKPATALESYLYSVNSLRGQYQGEANLAKR